MDAAEVARSARNAARAAAIPNNQAEAAYYAARAKSFAERARGFGWTRAYAREQECNCVTAAVGRARMYAALGDQHRAQTYADKARRRAAQGRADGWTPDFVT